MVLTSTRTPAIDADEPFPPAPAAPTDSMVVTGLPNVCILALDLATVTGWAVRRRDGRIVSGTADFRPRKGWSPGQRWQRFRSFLAETIVNHQVHAIAYEDVRRHMSTDSAHCYGALQAIMEMVADSNRLSLYPHGVGVVKKAWTGAGDASKDGMVAEAKRRGFRPSDDNEADALAILNVAVLAETRGKVGIGAGGLPDPSQAIRRPRTAVAKPEAGKGRKPAQRSLLGAGA